MVFETIKCSSDFQRKHFFRCRRECFTSNRTIKTSENKPPLKTVIGRHLPFFILKTIFLFIKYRVYFWKRLETTVSVFRYSMICLKSYKLAYTAPSQVFSLCWRIFHLWRCYGDTVYVVQYGPLSVIELLLQFMFT